MSGDRPSWLDCLQPGQSSDYCALSIFLMKCIQHFVAKKKATGNAIAKVLHVARSGENEILIYLLRALFYNKGTLGPTLVLKLVKIKK